MCECVHVVHTALGRKHFDLVCNFIVSCAPYYLKIFIPKVSLTFYLMVPNHKDLDTLRSGPRVDYAIKF